MTIYNNLRQDSGITSVEFASSAGANYAFFHIRNDADKAGIKQWLASPGNGLEIVAETQQNNQPTFVVKSAKTQPEIFSLLAAKGDSFAPYKPKKPFQAWAWRGKLSIIGQAFDFISVYIASKKGSRPAGDNAAYFLFAIFNVAASFVDIVFGAKVVTDKNRMRFLKTQVNEALTPYVPENSALPSVEDNVSLKLNGPEQPKAFSQKLYDFGRRNSVYIDMVLRYFGNMNLILPITNWRKPGWEKFNKNPYTLAAGVSLIVGKSITAFSKVPDPYSTAPSTALDKVREKAFFKTGNAIESLSAVFMGYNSFKGADINGVHKSNPTAGVANVIFMFGYGARWFAPFGVRKMDMPELEAHISEGLAKVPRDKLPQLIADIAANMKSNLKDEPLEFGQLYTQVLDNLNKHHHIALPANAVNKAPQVMTPESKAVFASESLKKPVPTIVPAPTHIERASVVSDAAIAYS